MVFFKNNKNKLNTANILFCFISTTFRNQLNMNYAYGRVATIAAPAERQSARFKSSFGSHQPSLLAV
ncbi:hypothetical protein B0I21_10477 [Sphingobacterium paludis]|uniref:Uncharacterized protein n=1 Tax=Sphingobacterium paludis TaxID=1476465 RepID=A0A4R7D136_9SPHI|nr:hypothetical protein B0I21_10477 [Sphingobacterium paludis]